MPNYANESEYTDAEIKLWALLKAHQRERFYTKKGLAFTYTIRGNELFVDRRDRSITRSTVNHAYGVAVALGKDLKGPKMLSAFGASYIYSIFLALGVIKQP